MSKQLQTTHPSALPIKTDITENDYFISSSPTLRRIKVKDITKSVEQRATKLETDTKDLTSQLEQIAIDSSEYKLVVKSIIDNSNDIIEDETYPALIAVKMSNARANTQPVPVGWLYCKRNSDDTYSLLYSKSREDNLKFICKWDSALCGSTYNSPFNYCCNITKNDDFIFVFRGEQLVYEGQPAEILPQARRNPIIYSSTDYANPKIIYMAEKLSDIDVTYNLGNTIDGSSGAIVSSTNRICVNEHININDIQSIIIDKNVRIAYRGYTNDNTYVNTSLDWQNDIYITKEKIIKDLSKFPTITKIKFIAKFTDEREILSSDNFSQLIKVKRDDGTKIITPTSWLQNCGVENIYSKNTFMFCEYTRPCHDKSYVWRIKYPYDLAENWEIVKEFNVSGSWTEGFKHCHSISLDPWSQTLILATGDDDIGAKIYSSTDYGTTWNLALGNGEKYCRLLNFIYTEKAVYWTTDTGKKDLHFLFKCNRNNDNTINFNNIIELFEFPYLPSVQATYCTAYIREANGLLILDRFDNDTNDPMKVYFYSLEKEKMYIVATLKPTVRSKFGFRVDAINWYQSLNSDNIVCGFGYASNTIDLLGNKDNKIKNLALSLKRI